MDNKTQLLFYLSLALHTWDTKTNKCVIASWIIMFVQAVLQDVPNCRYICIVNMHMVGAFQQSSREIPVHIM